VRINKGDKKGRRKGTTKKGENKKRGCGKQEKDTAQ
jgi:hypothetical protein